MFDPEISKAFQTSNIAPGGCSLKGDLELCRLNFHHDTQHFSLGMFMQTLNTSESTKFLKRMSGLVSEAISNKSGVIAASRSTYADGPKVEGSCSRYVEPPTSPL